MDSNAVYYTLSTIAQALATGAGLLAAFAAVQFNYLTSKLAEHCNGLSNQFSTEWQEPWARGDFAEIIRHARASDPNTLPAHRLQYDLPLAERFLSTYRGAVLELKIALVATLFVVGACFLALPFAPHLAALGAWSYGVLAVFGVAGCGCLYTYYRAIMKLHR